MKVALLGATGRVGIAILSLLLENNYEVTALVRKPSKLKEHPNLTIINGNALVAEDIEKMLHDVDAVVSALGTDKSTVLTESMVHIINCMEKKNSKRIVLIGTAGVLNSRRDEGLLRYQSSESKRKTTTAAKEHHRVYDMLRKSTLDWTIICPTYLPTGAATNAYRVEIDFLPEGAVQTTTGDTALFAVKELWNENYIGHRVGIVSPD